jgi:hypothetical protein
MRRTAMTETYEVARGSDGLHRWRRPVATRLVLVTATVPPVLKEV